MQVIENVNRRGATYWWRRRVRFVGRLPRPITIVTTVSLLTKDQSVARRRAAAMTGRSEVVRMSLYERIEQEGLTSEQVNHLFREEVVRYRNMLAHQLAAIEKDGEGDVTARMLVGASWHGLSGAVDRSRILRSPAESTTPPI